MFLECSLNVPLQGMNFVAGLLLLHLDEAAAFAGLTLLLGDSQPPDKWRARNGGAGMRGMCVTAPGNIQFDLRNDQRGLGNIQLDLRNDQRGLGNIHRGLTAAPACAGCASLPQGTFNSIYGTINVV
jgi:hypothetical protein